MLRDLRYRRITGVINIQRARVVYHEGKLHIWSRDGSYQVHESTAPKTTGKRTVVAGLNTGDVTMERCCGCGMPMRIRMRRNAKSLLATQRK